MNRLLKSPANPWKMLALAEAGERIRRKRRTGQVSAAASGAPGRHRPHERRGILSYLRAVRLARMLFVVALAVVSIARSASAEQPTLSGRWSASAMQSAWNIGDWGSACGPRPTGAAASAEVVSIEQASSELTISGAGRTYRTTECWEQFPGMRRVSHSGGQRGWRTVCQSSPNDSRQATLITTVSANDTYITFDETGQYQFVIQGQNCTASVRRSRSFKLIQRQGEAPPEPASSAPVPRPAETLPKAPPKATRCKEIGPPARLEVRPSRKLMRPGESFTFRALVLDAKGCLLTTAPTWSLPEPNAHAKLIGPGTVRVDENAPESEIELRATVGGRAARVLVAVASTETYDALLRRGGFNELGESEDAAVAVIASGSIGARSSVARERGKGRRRAFIAAIGAAALLLGVVAVLIVVRSRRRQEPEPAPPEPLVKIVPPRDARQQTTMICPTCRLELSQSNQFCPNDGNRLIPLEPGADSRGPTGGICPVCGQGYDPGVVTCPEHSEDLIPAAIYFAERRPPAPTAKICPICGTQYPGDGSFCGVDGAALVPVN
jgi:hypothetical protein